MRAMKASAIILLMAAGGGCAFESETTADDGAEIVGKVEQGLEACPSGATCFDRTDPTGAFTVRVLRCGYVGPARANGASCRVGSEFALVGGGAEVEGSPTPGGILLDSFPIAPGTTPQWYAVDSSHIYPQNTRLRAYSIGLKVNGLTGAQLQAKMAYSSAVSTTDPYPGAIKLVPAGHILLSVGATTDSGNIDQPLTAVYPANPRGIATSKQHLQAVNGRVTVYVTSMTQCPLPGVCFSSSSSSARSSEGLGYRSVTYNNPSSLDFVTGVGASAGGTEYNLNSGRVLTDMFPLMSGLGGAYASSKDYAVNDSGAVTAFITTIRRL